MHAPQLQLIWPVEPLLQAACAALTSLMGCQRGRGLLYMRLWSSRPSVLPRLAWSVACRCRLHLVKPALRTMR